MNELKFERAIDLIVSLLNERGLAWYQLARPLDALWKEIFSTAQPEARRPFDLQRKIRRSSSLDEERGFVIAMWVGSREAVLSPLWIAAMAQDAVLQSNYFAFGYLVALLDQKEFSDPHYIRSRKHLESASAGGRVRALKVRTRSAAVLDAMQPYVAKGHSPSRAGQLVFERKRLGTSGPANAKIWARYKK